jgi:hypothetical protein
MRRSLPPHISEDHPLVSQEYAVYTAAMAQMINTLGDWIDQQIPGGYIYGPSRFGKSRCVKWHMTDVLEQRFKDKVPFVIWPRVPDGQSSEAAFWHNLLLSARYHFTNPEKIAKKAVGRFQLLQLLITMARAGGSNYVALLIDEAQGMTLKEWNWLLGIQNQLDWDGYRLAVFSVGSHQIRFQPDFIASLGDPHIVARFFASKAPFYGIRSVDELRFILMGYDIDSEWPRGSGTSYLQYFAPELFAGGARLASCAPTIWNVFNELLPPEFSTDTALRKIQYPMQHLAFSVERALFRLAGGEDWDNVTSEESWLEMIAKTQFTNHMRDVARAA